MHRAGLVRAFADALGSADRLLLLPIFFAGGSVTRDITADDYARDLRAADVDVATEVRDETLPARIAAACRPGDRVVVMGARDPTLPDLARAILHALGPSSSAARRR